MPQTAAPRSRPEPPPEPAAPQADAPASGSDPETRQPEPAGALFRALVAAGCDPSVAYTADHQTRTMDQGLLAAQLQPLVAEMRRRFDGQDRKLTVLAEGGAERDRKLDVLAAQMRLVLGGLGVLVTVLIAVFGFLFAS